MIAAPTEKEDLMYLCESCRKGKLEMCPYFREHFLESNKRVTFCPEYEPDEETDEMEACLYACQ